MELLLWALAGWCGTPWPRRWPGGTPVPPPPDPWVPWKIAGIVGGLALGFVTSRYGGPAFAEPMPGLIAAFIGGRVLSDITDRFASGPSQARAAANA